MYELLLILCLLLLSFLQLMKEKVAFGKTLTREVHLDNTTRYIPYDIVEARERVKWFDDGQFAI